MEWLITTKIRLSVLALSAHGSVHLQFIQAGSTALQFFLKKVPIT